jgi:hypothetical protein
VKKSGVFATPSGFASGSGGGTRDSVLKAAAVFLAQAKKNASRITKTRGPATRIVANTFVSGTGEQAAEVVTDGNAAPNAAPFEFGERHPLFGNRRHWYPQPRRSYMSNAASSSKVKEKAAEAYAEAERDLLAKEYGYTG